MVPQRIQSSTTLLALIFCFLLFGCIEASNAQQSGQFSHYKSDPFSNGEVLRYKVKWGFIRLGTVEIRQTIPDASNPSRFQLQMKSKSAAGLPFIDVDVVNRSLLDARLPRGIETNVIENSKKKSRTTYVCNPKIPSIDIERLEGNLSTLKKSIPFAEPYFDALGTIMLARCIAGNTSAVPIAVTMDYQIKKTMIQYSRTTEMMDVDAFEDEIPARMFTLKSDWQDNTVGGMKGDITCWVSADDAAIPLRAEIDIALGSIVIELESCSRPGWSPSIAQHFSSK